VYVGLGVFFLVVGLTAIMQGQIAVGFVGLALAGIELGLFALIRSTRSNPCRLLPPRRAVSGLSGAGIRCASQDRLRGRIMSHGIRGK